MFTKRNLGLATTQGSIIVFVIPYSLDTYDHLLVNSRKDFQEIKKGQINNKSNIKLLELSKKFYVFIEYIAISVSELNGKKYVNDEQRLELVKYEGLSKDYHILQKEIDDEIINRMKIEE